MKRAREEEKGGDKDKAGDKDSAQEGESETKGRPKISKHLYQLIISQLRDDGFHHAAAVVSESTLTPMSGDVDKHRLSRLVVSALTSERAFGDAPPLTPTQMATGMAGGDDEVVDVVDADKGATCLDLDAPRKNVKPIGIEVKFTTTHKATCRVAAFAGDGKLAATGSNDNSIKILDVNKMLTHTPHRSEQADDYANIRPVIRTFYDHTAAVTDIDFHPRGTPLLISGSKDCSIKFFDLSKTSNKRSFRQLQDTHPVRSLQFHPSGEYVLAGTEHPAIRLYNVETFQCFTTSNPLDNHTSPINQVRYHCEANLFASCGKDGGIKLWDGVTHRCVRQMGEKAQASEPTSIRFSRNGQYLLTNGKDFVPRLWDLASGRQVLQYSLPNVLDEVQPNVRVQSVFSQNEEFVYSSDATARSLCVWNAQTGEFLDKYRGHQGSMRWISTSPTGNQLLTCSDDYRARFWCVP